MKAAKKGKRRGEEKVEKEVSKKAKEEKERPRARRESRRVRIGGEDSGQLLKLASGSLVLDMGADGNLVLQTFLAFLAFQAFSMLARWRVVSEM